MAPFLEVITRCFKRPEMLAHNQESLDAQTCADWEQTLLVDEVGRGVGWAQSQLYDYSSDLTGDYIWLLDDDDMCVRVTLVGELRQIAEKHDPDVIMIRMNHGLRGIHPDDEHWQQEPTLCFIGCSAYVVRREVWQRHADAWLSASYSSDYDFISAVFSDSPSVFWHDVIGSQVQRISLGREEVCA